MKHQHPIFIATKGRAGTAKVLPLLDGCNFTLVVEPQDHHAYASAYPGVSMVALPENNRGIAFARQWILERARSEGLPWFWMMDDDVTGFFRVESGKCVRYAAKEVLLAAEMQICRTAWVALGALEYQQYAWSQKKDRVMDSYCDVAVLINTRLTKLSKYRDGVKEDRDFVLQNLANGFSSMRTSHLAFSAPKNGTNKGGLHDAYKSGLERHWSMQMCKLWPEVCTLHVKKDGRPDVKINWKFFKNRHEVVKA